MKLIIDPGGPLLGVVDADLPGDKSISHRAALFAALATGTSRIENFQVSGVTRPLLRALTALGVRNRLDGHSLTVEGKGLSGLSSPASTIDCGNSATSLRLLAGALAAAGIDAKLDGSSGLRQRPMQRIVEPLRQMGVPIKASPSGTAPLRLSARPTSSPLTPLHYTLPVASAQVSSCLLLAGLGAAGTTILKEPGPSRDHTVRMLTSMGVRFTSRQETSPNGNEYVIEMTPPRPMVLSPLAMTIPGDPSAAAFLIVAALITPGSALTINNICLNPGRTGLVDALHSMGAAITVNNLHTSAGEPVGDLSVSASVLHGTEVSGELVVRMIDEFPIFAVAAALAMGTTIVRDAAELRLKESDRIALLAAEMRLLGAEVEEHADGFTINGGTLRGGSVQSHGDHRLAMALAVAGLAAETSVLIQGAECMDESFPGFSRVLQKLGASLRTEEPN
jgi:3-phosphoshikimate 1-carboxyvinyltransferase